MVHYYIAKIKRISNLPINCVNCKSGDLIQDAILASTGPTQENTDYKPSVLCLACETLMIITDNKDLGLGLQASIGNEITLRS